MKAALFSSYLKEAGMAAWLAGHKIQPEMVVRGPDEQELKVTGVSYCNGNIIIQYGGTDAE